MKSAFTPSVLLRAALLSCGLAALSAAAPTAEQIQSLLKNRPENDEIRWRDSARGAPIKVRITSAGPQGVVVDKMLQAGLTTRTVPMSDLSAVEFGLTPVEVALHKAPDPAAVPALRVIWNARKATLAIPGSNASNTGLVLAKSLRLVSDLSSFEEAGQILNEIRSQDLSDYRKDLARAEQVTIDFTKVLKGGRKEDISKMAWKITEGADNPEAMMLATAWLCDHSFADLKEVERDNPRWMEDDAVKPVRDRLYNLALDFALYPSLFYSNSQLESSTGLKKAAEVYAFTGQRLLEKGVLEDLASLYPETAAAKETAPALAKLKQLEADGKLDALPAEPQPESAAAPEEEKKEEEKPATGEPAPSKKYNVFGD